MFAHFLFPAGFAGLLAARASRAPLVVMAHGQDVANLDRVALRRATAPVLRGSAAVIANSSWLAGRLTAHFPRVRPVVIDLGVDLAQFAPGATAAAAWPGEHPRFLCVGSLIERKNVVALADAFERLGRGSLVFVGDGPLRAQLESRAGVTVIGRIPHAEIPRGSRPPTSSASPRCSSPSASRPSRPWPSNAPSSPPPSAAHRSS